MSETGAPAMSNDDRPIKAHLDEEMRGHIEFALRRYLAECEEWKRRASRDRRFKCNIDAEVELTRKCIDEINQAGT